MSKYEPLWSYIKENKKEDFLLTFDEVKDILGFPIDHSFLTYKKELMEYGFIVEKISMKTQTINFKKTY